MSTFNLHANKVSLDVINGAWVLSFGETSPTGDVSHYLMLQRAECEEYDEGIYLEIDDQKNSGFNLVKRARCAGGRLTLDIEPCLQRLGSPSEVVVSFHEDERSRAQIDRGTKKILQYLMQ